VATGIRFYAEHIAKDRMRLPARLKGGGIKRMADLRRPAFLGALLDVLPKCIGRIGPSGEVTEGIHNNILTNAIGRGAYDQNGHKNAGFLAPTDVGPYPSAMQYAWSHTRLDAAHNIGLALLSSAEKWGKLGPLASETPGGGGKEKEQRSGRGRQTTGGW
jgi:hypothetical protein